MYTHTVVEKPRSGFWGRQFDGSPTKAQIIFDVIFGIAMPVLCFVLDPGIIRERGYVPFAILQVSNYAPLVYGLSALSFATLGLWLSFGRRIGSWGGLISGVLLAGTTCSLLIGVAIFPLSVVGTLLVIGLLGFTPLITGLVYARNAVRSFNQARIYMARPRAVRMVLLAWLLAFALPGVANWQASRTVARSMDEILRGDERSVDDAAYRLRYLSWYADPDRIVFAYEEETDPIRKEQLSKAYKKITGNDMEDRLARLRRSRD